MLEIVQIQESDFEDILALNEASVPHVNSIDHAELKSLGEQSKAFIKVVEEGVLAGLVIALPPGQHYQSMNYRWFSEKFDQFLYIDRIMVSPDFRRRGVATLIYDELAKICRDANLKRLTCEVNILPPNPGSIAMHHSIGFKQVDTQKTDGGKKEVSLLAKEIPVLDIH
jgi:predicted GNAT superfamily acetyltransferase